MKDAPHLRVRLAVDLVEFLRKSAFENGRTITGEIRQRLEESRQNFKSKDLIEHAAKAAAHEVIAELIKRARGEG